MEGGLERVAFLERETVEREIELEWEARRERRLWLWLALARNALPRTVLCLIAVV